MRGVAIGGCERPEYLDMEFALVPAAISKSGQIGELELSVVIPCLNEAETVGTCVGKAVRWIRRHEVAGEVIVADNGSTDGSCQIAVANGAKVVSVAKKGYGSALMGGIEHARGRYVIMGDADDSYDFSSLDGMLEKLRQGFPLVQGCRLPSGGGTIKQNAMPLLHRWIGNPLFTFLARFLFASPVHDVNCGLRGFSKALYYQLQMSCTGMEFAVEMIIKASLLKVPIGELPVTLHRDGRKTRRPHLRTFQDGWRTLRVFLVFQFAASDNSKQVSPASGSRARDAMSQCSD
jgi:glycosyltransferase involved in cell wall biosynthesis